MSEPLPLQDILSYRDIPVSRLALMLSGRKDIDTTFILRQVEGWQRLRTKVPRWAEIEGLYYPPRISLEQCSSELAARYKAHVVSRLFHEQKGERLTDLTGGLGVDFSWMAEYFEHAVYVEHSEELCNLARHNFPLLGLERPEIIRDDATAYLKKMPPADLIFLDPARRDGLGRKTVRIEDCEPNVASLLPLLKEKARFVIIKLSPMLDIMDSLRQLSGVTEVHIVSISGECKDLLLVIDRESEKDIPPTITAAEWGDTLRSFTFTHKEEEQISPLYAHTLETYLYEPGPSVLKAAAFKTIGRRFDLKKLHPAAHLYTDDRLVENFPGRIFKVVDVYSFNKADLARLRKTIKKANLTVRGFPATVDELRKKSR